MTSPFSENAGRGEPVAPPGADDAIPLLTDVVLLADAPTPAGAPRALEDDWAILAIKVETSVAERLMTHAAPLLDGALNDLLPPLLARAAAQLTEDLRDGLSTLVRELVARAVAEELARLRAQHTQPQHLPAP